MNPAAWKYWAFISYSHRDSRVATALQRALETYRLPRHLVRKPNATGTVPAHLKPVFLDRGDLQASTDLKGVVHEALAQSRYLIVVCSPDAAQSAWVNQEIAGFKKMHGASRVLAVIAAGEPFASRMPGREADECFPPALRRVLTPDGRPEGEELEPIAADLRPGGDGKRRAVLKLAAGMVGVGADELIRRDAQRRARRLGVIAAASVAGMAVMAVLTVTAIRARNEAQTQRAQAEDLIEYMLGDLRKRLDAVGRLDTLDSVGGQALGYYAKQDVDRLDANELGRRSRALHLIGEMREQRGQLEAALNAFRRGAETTAQLLRRAPNDPQRIFDHAQSVYWVGYIAWRRGQVAAAENAFREYLALAQRLVATDPHNPDWQAEIAWARRNVGVVYLNTGRVADALALFVEERETWQRIVALRPAYSFELANAVGWIAKAHEALGDFDHAIAAQEEKSRVLQMVPDAATNKRVQLQQHNIAYERARLELALGRLPAAVNLAQSAVQQAQTLVIADPQNKFWLEQLTFAQGVLAEAQAAVGDFAVAREISHAQLAGCAKLTALDPTVASWHVNLKGGALVLAARLATDAERPALIDRLAEFLLKARDFASADLGANTSREMITAEAELMLGNLLARDGRAPEAAGHWSAAAARVDRYAELGNLPAMTLLARAQVRLGDRASAQQIAQRIASTTFRHPAYAELTHQLSDGGGLSEVQPQK